MDKHKYLEKPIIIDIRKPIGGISEILKDGNGKVRNEGHPLKFVSFLDFEKQLPLIKAQGFTLISLVQSGNADEKEVKKLLGIEVKETKAKAGEKE